MKKPIIFWKKPAFDLTVVVLTTSLPYISVIYVPSASLTFAEKVVSPLEFEIALTLPSASTLQLKQLLSAVHSTVAPSGIFAKSGRIRTPSLQLILFVLGSLITESFSSFL